jgi:hypothetical protein
MQPREDEDLINVVEGLERDIDNLRIKLVELRDKRARADLSSSKEI